MRVAIVDDEKHCSATLRFEIERNLPEMEVVAEFNDPMVALKEIPKLNLQLLFLDIEMPRLNGFELLQALPETPFGLVFTTAYDEFALKAFQFSAIDYLLKPISGEDLLRALKRFKEQGLHKITDAQLEMLFHRLDGKQLSKIALPSSEGLDFVEPSEIIRCESQSNYTMVYFKNKRKCLVSRTLKEIEELLMGHGFFRVHHSHLVNLNGVQRYVKGSGGYLVMDDEVEVPVSRSRKEGLLSIFLKGTK